MKRRIQEELLKNRPQSVHLIVHNDLKTPGAMSQFTFQLLRDLRAKELRKPTAVQAVPFLTEIDNLMEASPFKFTAERGYQRKRTF